MHVIRHISVGLLILTIGLGLHAQEPEQSSDDAITGVDQILRHLRNKSFSVKFSSGTLRKALEKLNDVSRIQFRVHPDTPHTSVPPLTFNDGSIRELLTFLLQKDDLACRVRQKHIVIGRRPDIREFDSRIYDTRWLSFPEKIERKYLPYHRKNNESHVPDRFQKKLCDELSSILRKNRWVNPGVDAPAMSRQKTFITKRNQQYIVWGDQRSHRLIEGIFRQVRRFLQENLKISGGMFLVPGEMVQHLKTGRIESQRDGRTLYEKLRTQSVQHHPFSKRARNLRQITVKQFRSPSTIVQFDSQLATGNITFDTARKKLLHGFGFQVRPFVDLSGDRVLLDLRTIRLRTDTPEETSVILTKTAGAKKKDEKEPDPHKKTKKLPVIREKKNNIAGQFVLKNGEWMILSGGPVMGPDRSGNPHLVFMVHVERTEPVRRLFPDISDMLPVRTPNKSQIYNLWRTGPLLQGYSLRGPFVPTDPETDLEKGKKFERRPMTTGWNRKQMIRRVKNKLDLEEERRSVQFMEPHQIYARLKQDQHQKLRALLRKHGVFPSRNCQLRATIHSVPNRTANKIEKNFPLRTPLSRSQIRRYRNRFRSEKPMTHLGTWHLATTGRWSATVASMASINGVTELTPDTHAGKRFVEQKRNTFRAGTAFATSYSPASGGDTPSIQVRFRHGRKKESLQLQNQPKNGDVIDLPLQLIKKTYKWTLNKSGVILDRISLDESNRSLLLQLSPRINSK